MLALLDKWASAKVICVYRTVNKILLTFFHTLDEQILTRNGFTDTIYWAQPLLLKSCKPIWLPPLCILIYTFYLCLHVGLLDSIAYDLTVAVILGRLPFQRNIEAPHFSNMHVNGGTRLFCWVLWEEIDRRDRVGGFRLKLSTRQAY